MNKDFYIRLRDNKSIILDDYNDGMSLSVHIPGGHITIFLDKNEASGAIILTYPMVG